MNRTFLPHLMIFTVYFGVMVLVKLVFGGIQILDWPLLGLLLGGVLGMTMPLVDRLVYVYYSKPHEQLSMQVKMLISKSKFGEAMNLLAMRGGEQVRLSTNNVLFMAVWVMLAIFLITSSGQEFAEGLVLGLGLKMSYDLWLDNKRPEYLMGRLFWPLKRHIYWEETKRVVWVFWGVFGAITALSV